MQVSASSLRYRARDIFACVQNPLHWKGSWLLVYGTEDCKAAF